MAEDDFDIYGEDDGFTTKGQVVSFFFFPFQYILGAYTDALRQVARGLR